mmetsp:Transcript_5465/g.13426  ORF Transcript_5465/g.13426 Transcript_5465/m.13426 type:complete len:216 (-) Transcript_5465:764-1411(-)
MAPEFSMACMQDRAPEIGMAPWQSTQLRATCAQLLPWRWPTSRKAANNRANAGGSASRPVPKGRVREPSRPQRGPAPPKGSNLPESRPIAKGEYASTATPIERQAATRPLEHGSCRTKLSSTWHVLSARPWASQRRARMRRSSSKEQLQTPTARARPARTTAARPSACSSKECGGSATRCSWKRSRQPSAGLNLEMDCWAITIIAAAISRSFPRG